MKGVETAGISEDKKSEFLNSISEYLENENMLLRYMEITIKREFVTQLKKDSEYFVEMYKQVRSEYSKINKVFRYRVFLVNHFFDFTKDNLNEYYIEMGKIGYTNEILLPVKIFESEESTIEFLESVPSLNVRLKLSYQIINDLSRPFDKNDYHESRSYQLHCHIVMWL